MEDEMLTPTVRVRIHVTIDPPGSRPGENVTDISQTVSSETVGGELVTHAGLVNGCLKEAIKSATCKVMAMVSTEYPAAPRDPMCLGYGGS